VEKITELKTTPRKAIKLPKAFYRFRFHRPNDDRLYHMVDTPTLREAKQLAEWYYSEWLAVNSNGTVSGKRER